MLDVHEHFHQTYKESLYLFQSNNEKCIYAKARGRESKLPSFSFKYSNLPNVTRVRSIDVYIIAGENLSLQNFRPYDYY